MGLGQRRDAHTSPITNSKFNCNDATECRIAPPFDISRWCLENGFVYTSIGCYSVCACVSTHRRPHVDHLRGKVAHSHWLSVTIEMARDEVKPYAHRSQCSLMWNDTKPPQRGRFTHTDDGIGHNRTLYVLVRNCGRSLIETHQPELRRRRAYTHTPSHTHEQTEQSRQIEMETRKCVFTRLIVSIFRSENAEKMIFALAFTAFRSHSNKSIFYTQTQERRGASALTHTHACEHKLALVTHSSAFAAIAHANSPFERSNAHDFPIKCDWSIRTMKKPLQRPHARGIRLSSPTHTWGATTTTMTTTMMMTMMMLSILLSARVSTKIISK